MAVALLQVAPVPGRGVRLVVEMEWDSSACVQLEVRPLPNALAEYVPLALLMSATCCGHV